jgi:hypothetical protein
VADVPILVSGVSTTLPEAYPVPSTQEIVPKSVTAIFDGSAAATGFVPVLRFISDAGIEVAVCEAPVTVAAGGSARVSWFPGGGIDLSGTGTATGIGARIQNNLGQTIATDTWTTLAYERTIYDTDGMVNLAADNTKLTVNTSGLYLVAASTQWQNNNAGKRMLAVTHNDVMTNVAISEDNYVFDQRMPVWDRLTGLVDQPQTTQLVVSFWQANVGDFFSSGAFQLSGSGVGLGLHGYTYFSATLVGA